MATTWQGLVCLSLLWSAASAQTITPTNGTDHGNYSNGIVLRVARTKDKTIEAAYPVIPLTHEAGADVPGPSGLIGPIQLSNASNLYNITAEEIAFISCDPNGSNIEPANVFEAASSRNATAIVFYSTTASTCQVTDLGPYRWVYALTSVNSTADLLDTVNALTAESPHRPWAGIGNGDSTMSSGTGSNSNDGNQTNPLGPSPNTAVAMIILYSITGVITALFLIIIITGAIRAHRHPERYGPRNGIGRPRQTRARGIARAMLDSIPIVKFGDRENDRTKPAEVELEGGQHARVEYLSEQDRTAETTQNAADANDETTPRETAALPEDAMEESGIAAAVNSERRASTEEDNNQGCSICTEDFEVGQDQRVLPCDHRFHPACIDPWLLNVSGTCPLCRIDLRPQSSESTEDVDTDEFGNPIRPEGENLAPPLGEEVRRSSVRRSIILGLMGTHRPERLTREERVQALRVYRERVVREENLAADAQAAVPAQTEEESSRRKRLRNVFRIRTRRAGEEDPVREENQAEEQASAAQSSTDVQQAPATQCLQRPRT